MLKTFNSYFHKAGLNKAVRPFAGAAAVLAFSVWLAWQGLFVWKGGAPTVFGALFIVIAAGAIRALEIMLRAMAVRAAHDMTGAKGGARAFFGGMPAAEPEERSQFNIDASSADSFNTAAPAEVENKAQVKTPANKMKHVPRPR